MSEPLLPHALRDPALFPIRFDQRILFSDVDLLRHLNNGAVGRLFEEGRAETSRRVFAEEGSTPVPRLVLARITIEYLKEGHYPGMIELCTGIGRIGTSSLEFVQAAFQDAALIACARAVMVKTSGASSSPLTVDERTALLRISLPN